MSGTTGVYMLQPAHAAALEGFRSDPSIGRLLRDGAAAFVAAEVAKRDAGTGFAFVIENRGQLVGLCRLGGVGQGVAGEVAFWVAPPFRRAGHATFGVKMLLEFAFKNLSLAEVRARAPDEASERVLARNGFAADPGTGEHRVTKNRWREALDEPALRRLHPGLRKIRPSLRKRAAGHGARLLRLARPRRAGRGSRNPRRLPNDAAAPRKRRGRGTAGRSARHPGPPPRPPGAPPSPAGRWRLLLSAAPALVVSVGFVAALLDVRSSG